MLTRSSKSLSNFALPGKFWNFWNFTSWWITNNGGFVNKWGSSEPSANYGDIGDLLFQRTFGMSDYTQLKQNDNTAASMDV